MRRRRPAAPRSPPRPARRTRATRPRDQLPDFVLLLEQSRRFQSEASLGLINACPGFGGGPVNWLVILWTSGNQASDSVSAGVGFSPAGSVHCNGLRGCSPHHICLFFFSRSGFMLDCLSKFPDLVSGVIAQGPRFDNVVSRSSLSLSDTFLQG